MVAQGDAVIGEVVDHHRLELPLQFGEIGRALAEITGEQQEDLVRAIGVADGVHEGGPFDGAAHPVLVAAAQGLEVAVGVVGVQDDQPGPRLAGADGQQGRGKHDDVLSHC